ncbi:LemA family protein [candidate division KSB1 bacterium]|nr:LemA family protein [candidate division KSB1 bacterium]
MKKGCLVIIVLAAIAFFIFLWGKNQYNKLVEADETVKTAWSKVESAYQRRFDLIPNLVETVKGYAKHEKDVFVGVTEARSKMGGIIEMGPEFLDNPQKVKEFQQLQGEFSSALQRLMMVVENYPQLKADKNFQDLQVQLEGTENRIKVERDRFNDEVRTFNTLVRRFPLVLFAGMFGFSPKSYFQAEVGAEKAPKVQF